MNKQNLIDFSTKISKIYVEKNLRVTFHLSGGNEDQLIDIFKDIKETDYVFGTHRSHYHALLKGIPQEKVEASIIEGKSMYLFDRKRNFFTSCIIGGTAAIAVGVAWALKRKKSDQHVWCFIGDGTEDSGHFYEAMRYVDGWDLPCTFIIEDNNMAVNATKKDRWGTDSVFSLPNCVKRYYYTPTWPHIRAQGKLDLSKSEMPTNEKLFPKLDTESLPNFDHLLNEKISFKDAVKKSMLNISNNNGINIGYSVKFGNALDDFMLCAADAIVNHVNHIERISGGEFKTPVIIRSIVTDAGPFYAGPTHSQNFTEAFKNLVDFPIYTPKSGGEVLNVYNLALSSNRPSLIVEHKNNY